MIHHRKWTSWVAAILILGLVILAIWWAVASTRSNYVFLQSRFPDPTNRMCWCRPLPFEDFYCGTLGLKRVCCNDFDTLGRRCYCCTEDSPACHQKACSVAY